MTPDRNRTQIALVKGKLYYQCAIPAPRRKRTWVHKLLQLQISSNEEATKLSNFLDADDRHSSKHSHTELVSFLQAGGDRLYLP